MNESVKHNHTEDSKCDDCREDKFQYYCGDCKKYLCTDCNNSLHIKGIKSQHNRFGADNRQQQSQPQTNDESNICQEHSNQLAVWFCENCEQSICNKCLESLNMDLIPLDECASEIELLTTKLSIKIC